MDSGYIGPDRCVWVCMSVNRPYMPTRPPFWPANDLFDPWMLSNYVYIGLGGYLDVLFVLG